MGEQIRAPSPGAMKPKPFSALNHLTVPVAMLLFLLGELKRPCGADPSGSS